MCHMALYPTVIFTKLPLLMNLTSEMAKMRLTATILMATRCQRNSLYPRGVMQYCDDVTILRFSTPIYKRILWEEKAACYTRLRV